MSEHPKAFISHSHTDRDIATRIAEGLQASGVHVWFDKWEILPGDSLIRKIFNEGLAGADAFIILLSHQSVQSRWVQEELDAALIKRIEGVTRVIPVLAEDVEVPLPLRAVQWVDMSEDFDDALQQLLMAIFKVYQRPALGQPPEFVRRQLRSVGGLSPLGTSLGFFLISTGKHEVGNEETFRAAEIAAKLGLSPQETDDAIEELESLGLVKTYRYLGTAPFSYSEIQPTYALFLHFHDQIPEYDPEEDIKVVAAAIVAQGQTRGSQLQNLTQLSPLRINRAVAYLEDYGLVRVLKEMGSAPFNFGAVWATGATRRFVAEECN
jgi:DNA-binding MarR family transcriptional regulator